MNKTVKEIAKEFGVHPETVKIYIRKVLPGKMVNGKTTRLNEGEQKLCRMTIQQVADALGTDYDTIEAKAKDLGFTRNGVLTLLDEEQVQAIKDNHRPSSFERAENVANTVTKADEDKVIFNAFNILKQRMEDYKRQSDEAQPKVEFYDAVTGSNDTTDIGTVAKVLNLNIGRNKLFELLRNKKVMMGNNLPYQNFIDAGYFRVIESKYTIPDGTVHVNYKNCGIPKGSRIH